MAAAGCYSVTTADAGSVGIALPAGAGAPEGGIVVNTSLAGSVQSTGASNVPTIVLGAVGANSAATGGWVVTTIGAGAVGVGGRVMKVNTRHAGCVKIGLTNTRVAMPATDAGGDDPHGPGEGGNEQEGAKVSWKILAAAAAAATSALELFDLAHGDKLRVFLVVIVGAAEIHARGAIGRKIVYASLAMLLVGIAVYHSAWIITN